MTTALVNLSKLQKIKDFKTFDNDLEYLLELWIDFKWHSFDSSTREELLESFNRALSDDDIDLVWFACWGEIMLSFLNDIDFDLVKDSNKRFMWASDFTHFAIRSVSLWKECYYWTFFKNLEKYFPNIKDLEFLKDFVKNGILKPYAYRDIIWKVENLDDEKMVWWHLTITSFMLSNHHIDLHDRYLFLEYHYIKWESLNDLWYWIDQIKYVISWNMPKWFVLWHSTFFEPDWSVMEVDRINDLFIEKFKGYSLPIAYLDHFNQIIRFS